MTTTYDVVIVGARVAGSTLALRLARAGARVCVLERAAFPSPTISTHVLHTVAPLRELGALDAVLASGTPLLTETHFNIQGVRFTIGQQNDPGLCPRREILDTALMSAAVDAGAEVRCGVRVLEVLQRADGTAVGVVIDDGNGGRAELTAGAVVGADGRNSTVARAVGARRYLITSAPRPAFYGYFEGVPAPPALIWQRLGDHLVAGAPTDSGLFLTFTQPSPHVAPKLRAEDGRQLAEYVSKQSPELGELLDGARPVGEVKRMPAYQCYFRESAGKSWALVGDAGHFKDVTPGQGINDAIRQSERLAGALLYGLSHPRHLARALHAYWVWRDSDAFDIYWFGTDMGRSGPLPDLAVDMLRSVTRKPKLLDAMHEVLAHRRPSTAVLNPPRLFAATAAQLLRGPLSRSVTLAQMSELIRTDTRRKVVAARRLSVAPDLGTAPVASPAPENDHIYSAS